MKKNEKRKVKGRSASQRQPEATTGLPPDKSSFFTFYFLFFNFQNTVIVLSLFVLLFFSNAYARQTAKGDNIILSFLHYHAQYFMKKNDSLLSFSKLYAQKFFSNLYAQQSVKRDDALTGKEYQVKLGFIYNFAKFTKWRSDAFEKSDSPIQICLVSDKYDKSEVDALSALNGKYIRNRKIIVKNKNSPQRFIPLLNTIVQKEREPEDITGCHILFISSQDKDFIQEQLAAVENKNILTIGETEDFTKMCGIIRFFQKENRLRFEVNLGAAQRAELKLGTPLLMSAEIVKECQ